MIGTLKWKDGADKTHPARNIRYDVISDTLAGPNVRASGNLSDAGEFTISLAQDPLQPTAYIKFYAENSAGYVASDFAISTANIYTQTTSTFALAPSTAVQVDTTLGKVLDADNAFAVVDGILTGQRFLAAVRPGGSLPSLPARFPQISTHPVDDPPTSYYLLNKIRILDDDRWDFDVIGHEFSHYAHDKDRLTQSPGGPHKLGISNIPGRGKLPGSRLAWGEGVGNYMGVQTSTIDATGPTTLANYGDTSYTDTLDSSNNYNLETTFGSENAGEGDEVAVSRILWDLADPANEPHDRIARGAAQVYSDLLGARNRLGTASGTRLSTLNELNDYYMNSVATSDTDRKNFGAIFEANGVSPHPTGSLIQGIRNPDTDAITFEWDRQNNNASETFRIRIWNDTMTLAIAEILVPDGQLGSYTLTNAEKAFLKQHGGGNFLSWVVIGSDFKTPGGAAYAAADQTGNYWSDANVFYLVPEPATMATVGLATLTLARRRRA